MPRKPAIILFLLLLLSIGGALLFHQLRRDPVPPFTEVDAFLREGPFPADWRFVRHQPMRDGRDLNSDWTKWIGIRRTVHFKGDSYHYINELTSQEASIEVIRKDGRIARVDVFSIHQYQVALDAFEGHLFRKFPELSRYNGRTGLP